MAPPLVNGPLWEGLGGRASAYAVGVILGGMSGTIVADGQTYAGLVMPPQRHLSDEEVLRLAEYVLRDLNGHEAGATAEYVATVRADPPNHQQLRAVRQGGGA